VNSEAFYRGFVKEAFSGGHIAIAAGAALAGLAVYDFFKGLSLPTLDTKDLAGKGAERVKTVKHISSLLKEQPLKRPPVVVTEYEQLESALKGVSYSMFEKDMIRRFAKQVLTSKDNAFVVPDKKKDIIIIPPEIHKHVVEHELGHVRDFAEKAYERPGFLTSILSLLWKPTYNKTVMEREQRAWDYTKARKMREKALGSYERGFHFGRAPLAGGTGLFAILKGIDALRSAQHAKHSLPISRA